MRYLDNSTERTIKSNFRHTHCLWDIFHLLTCSLIASSSVHNVNKLRLLWLFLSICLLKPTYGIVQQKNKHERQTSEMEIYESLMSQPYMTVSMQPVSSKYFKTKLKDVETYHDILRIFYGAFLTDEAIDKMLSEVHMSQNSDYPAFGRPRIGGLNDAMLYTLNSPRLNNMVQSPLMLESRQADAPVNCIDCDGVSDNLRNHSRGQRHAPANNKKRHKSKYLKSQKNHKSKKRKRNSVNAPVSIINDVRKDLILATEHAKEMSKLAVCSKPVPVVIHIRDISSAANKEYFPSCTIVYHCRHDSGCCNETSICAPKTNVTITKHFFVFEYVKSGDLIEAKGPLVEKFTFLNHTECECQPVKQIPKCLECPFPFYLRRNSESDCICDCFDRDKTCLRIKKGRKALQKDQLTCIKEKRCHIPKCNVGEFGEESLVSGYCPNYRTISKVNKVRYLESLTVFNDQV